MSSDAHLQTLPSGVLLVQEHLIGKDTGKARSVSNPLNESLHPLCDPHTDQACPVPPTPYVREAGEPPAAASRGWPHTQTAKAPSACR